MSQEAVQQPPPRSYQPWPPPHSTDNFLPPAKRQKMDSAPSSPYPPQSPQTPQTPPVNFSNIALPNGYNPQRQTNGVPAPAASITPQRIGGNNMGPPQRPIGRVQDQKVERPERELDINELSDATIAAGINLREEEDAMAQSWRSNRVNAQGNLGGSTQTSFDLLSRNTFGAIGSQPAAVKPDADAALEQELFEKHKKAARAANESQQHHLDHPFLWGNGVRQRMQRIANDNGVRVPLDGLFDRVPDRPPAVTPKTTAGADANAIAMASAPSVLNRGTPLEPMLSLLSLAANERIRGLLEDAYGLARGRQYNSDGVVPPDWSDLVATSDVKPTTAVPASITQTSWDAVNGDASLAAIKEEQPSLPSPPNSQHDQVSQEPQAEPTVAVPRNVAITRALADLAFRDRAAEETRQKLRAARAAKKRAQAAAAAGATPDTDGVTTPTADGRTLPPGMLGEKAPEGKMSKKEMAKLAKQDVSDEVATRNTNTVALLQLGGLGKSYSWMTGGSKAAKPGRAVGGAAAKLAAAAAASAEGTGGGVVARARPDGWPAADRSFGEWREDAVGGKDIQLRDWVGVLEADGKERASLGWALMKLGDGSVTAAPGASAVQGAGQTPAQIQRPT